MAPLRILALSLCLSAALLLVADARLPGKYQQLVDASSPGRARGLGAVELLTRALSLFDFPAALEFDGAQQRLFEQPITMRPGSEPAAAQEGNGPDVGHYAGYFKLNRTHDARMFYWFFESRGEKTKDPLVLWMTGGPGCASELALFYENGPWHINATDLSLTWNPYGWDKVSNLIYIDQPVGTGFSYSDDPRDVVHDEAGVSQDVYEFLQEFLEAHPDYADRDFYVTGESYGGHYVPAVTSRVHSGNKRKEGAPIAIKGFAIGNGLTQPDIQFAAYADFALMNDLISQAQHDSFEKKYPVCAMAIRACGTKGKLACAAAYVVCEAMFQALLAKCGTGNLNVYDIRQNCTVSPLCYDFSPLDAYLNQRSVRAALGVGEREFQSCSTSVYQAMLLDFMRDLEPIVPPLLEDGLRLLVYAGEDDLICNWLGNSRWVAAMDWSGHDEYNAAPYLPLEVGGSEAGISKTAGALTFLRVHDAGHLVPMDQPAAALEMLHRFLNDEPMGDSPKELLPVAQLIGFE